MKPSSLAVIAAMLAGASASVIKRNVTRTLVEPPTKVEYQGACTATVEGSNSEGGGGPGQSPIYENGFGVDISGTNIYGQTIDYSSFENDNGGGGFDFTVASGDYGGVNNLEFKASWDYGDNAWNFCSVTVNGDYSLNGDVEPQHISSGTVSVTSSYCVVSFAC